MRLKDFGKYSKDIEYAQIKKEEKQIWLDGIFQSLHQRQTLKDKVRNSDSAAEQLRQQIKMRESMSSHFEINKAEPQSSKKVRLRKIENPGDRSGINTKSSSTKLIPPQHKIELERIKKEKSRIQDRQ